MRVEPYCGDSARVAYPLFQTEDGGSLPTSPLQFLVGKISLDKAIELNNMWHSRLPNANKSNMIRTKYRICLGASYQYRWYAVAIWTNPIARHFNDKNWLELRRFAISSDAPKNSASRLISVMLSMIKKELPFIKMVISYQDTEVHQGTIYKASGWYMGNKTKASEVRWGIQNKLGTSRKRNPIIASGAKIRWQKEIR